MTVIDRAHFPRDKACGEGLMPPGVAVLRRLDVLDAVLDTGSPRIRGVAYNHGAGTPTAYATFPPPVAGDERFGLGVRRTSFDAVLVDALRRAPGCTVLEGVRATGLRRDRSGRVVGVTTDDGPLTARCVVAADGLHSRCAPPPAGPGRPRAPAGTGWPATGRSAWPTWTGSRSRFAAGQEWYQAPVGPELLLVSTLADQSRLAVVARDYVAAARTSLPILRDAELASPPLAAGLFRQRPSRIAGGGLFLVGDAAGYDDPTTGEGIGAGLELGERLGGHLAALLSGEVDGATVEDRYARDHADLWRNRRRVTALALLMARHPLLSRRAVAAAAGRPRALETLLGVNCGYWGFGRLSARDWTTLAGF